MSAARSTGYVEKEDVLPFHLRLLQPDAEFR